MANIAVVIPAYRVRNQILSVLRAIGPEVGKIYVVDDHCPERSGRHVLDTCRDPRVEVIFHERNLGVGGATCSGYRKALMHGADIVVKIDGDGQMDPNRVPTLIAPIRRGLADYTKGNRFYRLEDVRRMPGIRLIGNAFLSLVSKITSGYWNIMDPTNGFTAIHREALRMLPLDKLEKRYFFENDMLFRLSTIRAVVWDVPIEAVYGDETSNLRIARVLFEFPGKFILRFLKRIGYNHFVRDFNLATLELIFGSMSIAAGVSFGLWKWYHGFSIGEVNSSGTVMLAALPIIVGFQLLISAINFDMQNVPNRPIQQMSWGTGATVGSPSSAPSDARKE